MTSTESHGYLVRLKQVDTTYSCNFKALDQEIIWNNIPVVIEDLWTTELIYMRTKVNDFKDDPIDIWTGADIAAKLFSGKRIDLSVD